MTVHRLATAQLAGVAAAEHVSSCLSAAIEARGVATIALSGGDSPRPLFSALAQIDLAWDRVRVHQVDERLVERRSPHRNWSMIETLLVGPTGATGCPLPVAHIPEVFDVVHLGLGSDGHTASWPPDHPVLEARGPLGFVREFNGHDRLTVTPPLVNKARSILWFVPGASKASVVGQLLDADPTIPASAVRRDSVEVYCSID